jgi:hypothetical protein
MTIRSSTGVEPLRSHVQAVLAHPEPTNISELQAFLGTVNFYRRFLPAGARTLKPLTDLLVGGPKGTEPVSLAEPQRAAFVAAKNALAAVTCLGGAPFPRFPTQPHGGRLCRPHRRRPAATAAAGGPVAAAQVFLQEAGQHTGQVFSFRQGVAGLLPGHPPFPVYAVGRRFTLYTDHKLLTTAVRRSTQPWTAKQCCQLAYIAEFTSDIQHIAGSDNVVADTLSRPPGGHRQRFGLPRADRGDKDKIKLSTSSGGLRSPVEENYNYITA